MTFRYPLLSVALYARPLVINHILLTCSQVENFLKTFKAPPAPAPLQRVQRAIVARVQAARLRSIETRIRAAAKGEQDAGKRAALTARAALVAQQRIASTLRALGAATTKRATPIATGRRQLQPKAAQRAFAKIAPRKFAKMSVAQMLDFMRTHTVDPAKLSQVLTLKKVNRIQKQIAQQKKAAQKVAAKRAAQRASHKASTKHAVSKLASKVTALKAKLANATGAQKKLLQRKLARAASEHRRALKAHIGHLKSAAVRRQVRNQLIGDPAFHLSVKLSVGELFRVPWLILIV